MTNDRSELSFCKRDTNTNILIVVHLMKENGVIEHDDVFQTCLKIEPDLFIPEQQENSEMNDPSK